MSELLKNGVPDKKSKENGFLNSLSQSFYPHLVYLVGMLSSTITCEVGYLRVNERDKWVVIS